MTQVTFQSNPIRVDGVLPVVGAKAPEFVLVGADLADISLETYAGKKKVLSVNPSFDTGVCQASARAFNQKISERGDAVVLAISADLPFAQKRFCEAEGLAAIVPASAFRSSFAQDYGLRLAEGPLRELTARAVLVLSETNEVLYVELVPEIVQEPNYDAAIAALG